MAATVEHVLLRAHLAKADRPPHLPTYQRLVRAAHEAGLMGGTVLEGIAGTGHHLPEHRSFWSLGSPPVPVVVEVLDTADRIAAFVRGPMDPIMAGGLVTLERAAVVRPATAAAPLPARIAPRSTLPTPRDLQTGSHMSVQENGIMLRLFLGSADRFDDQSLSDAIVRKVRELGLAGATVLRGTEGFGAHSVVHKADVLAMSSDLPVVVEIVDVEAKITAALPQLEPMVQGGMVTMEYVAILVYRHAGPAAADELPDHPDAMT